MLYNIMREWWNWQTRTFEGRVPPGIRVQVPFLAPKAYNPNRPSIIAIGEAFGFVLYTEP